MCRALAAVACLLTALSACRSRSETALYPESPNRPVNLSCVAPPRPPARDRVLLERAFTHVFGDGDDLPRAVHLARSPADPERWYVGLQRGQIPAFREDPADGQREVVLDVEARVYGEHDETGLLGFSFHPRFGENGLLFVAYSATKRDGEEGAFRSRLSRFETRDGLTFDPDSERIVLDLADPGGSHNLNLPQFGPDGYLYVAVGDGRNSSGARQNAQNTESLFGKVLRIDVDRTDRKRGTAYGIPEDNPFALGGGAPEVYAYGLRNPWRFSFDRETGALWLGDVGQDTREEVNRIEPGGNYGWPIKEGETCFGADECDEPGLIDPVLPLPHTGAGASITAGYVYRGRDIPALRGRFVFADYVSGNVYSIATDEEAPEATLESESGIGIVSFAESADGELYAVGYSRSGDGGLYRLVQAPPPERGAPFPRLLSQTGCLGDDVKSPAPGVLPYQPVAELWSDGAEKHRYLGLPGNRRIGVKADGDLVLPVGTVLVKHFGFDGRLHETRLLVHHEDGWAGYSYEWRDDQSDAVLLSTGKLKRLANGLRWSYPSRSECMTCHTSAAGRVLGLEVGQLRHARDAVPGEDEAPSGEQLEELFGYDVFVPDYLSPEALPTHDDPMPDPFGDAPVAQRARAYLHANCSHCHRPDGITQADIDLRYRTPLGRTGLCNAEPENGYLYTGDESLRLVKPGDPEGSILYRRMIALDRFRMPPLASEVVDERAVELIRTWIAELEGCPR